MCGIAGLIQYKGDVSRNIENMKNRMIHRGPDAEGTWISPDQKVALGHRRLSIVDLSANGAQPMESHSGRYVMAYNGEIYNYRTLSSKLLAEGKVSSFRGSSDSEVLLEAFEAYGIKETIEQCKGMFGIALYDRKEDKLYLLRDRVGEKPLYYGTVNGAFAFASDVGCIAELEDFQNEINEEVLDIYFVHGYIPAPYSIYKDIYKLEPGCTLTLQGASLEWETEPYWSMSQIAEKGQKNLFTGSQKEAADELERLLRASIKDQMVADVPVGAFLSAGIDSSTIVSLMQDMNSQKVRTFTIGMEEKEYNEAVFAKEIAQHLGTEHTELYVTDKDAKAVIPKLGYMFGEPFADSSQIPTYLVSKMTREHVTVSLSGDAGDELFCGYTSYNSVDRIWNKMKKVPYGLRKPASALIGISPLRKHPVYGLKGVLLGSKDARDLYRLSLQYDPIMVKIAKQNSSLSYKYTEKEKGIIEELNHQIMLMDLTMYHPDDILVKVDRSAMAVSLETRVPMLDKDVVEFAWTLPVEYLRKEETGKQVLRDVLYRYVPKEMMERPKKGFSIPVEKWLLEPELRKWAEELIEPGKIAREGMLDPKVVTTIWRDFTEKGIWRVQIWYILMFEQWLGETKRA